jgi:thiol:disulfide interchange protein DsbA
MHKEGNMLQTEKRVKEFLAKFGIAPEISSQYLNSFTIRQKISRDAKHAKQLLLTSTPMIVVDGTYIVQSKGSFSDMLKVVDHLVELQKPNS